MITIDVGADHAKYSVYAELISYYSGYFKGTLNGSWKEAEDRVIELPDIEPRVFDIFIDWLYTKKLPWKTRDWVAPSPENDSGSHGHGQQAERLMMKVYVFADRFLVPELGVAMFRYFANFCNNGGNPPYYDAILYAFDNLPSTSPMLTLLVKLHCAYWNENSDTEDNGELELRQDLPHDFLLRGMEHFAKMRDKSKAKEIAICDCHKESATSGRQGCDTCNPLPEVKEETTAENGVQVDAAAADGNDQANQNDAATANNDATNGDQAVQIVAVPADNVGQAQNVDQDAQDGGGAQTNSTGALAGNLAGNQAGDQAGDQADAIALPSNGDDGEPAETTQAVENTQNDGHPHPPAQEPTEAVLDAREGNAELNERPASANDDENTTPSRQPDVIYVPFPETVEAG